MGISTAPYIDAIDHLPPGSVLVVPGVSWDEYERLIRALADRPGVRISYDDGRLQVMSPSAEHEEYKDLVLRLVQAAADEMGLLLETRGSTTWKRRGIHKGVEPDTCFYVARAPEVIGRRTIDLDSSPPPDVAVEIDLSHESVAKMRVYAALGVPEVWRYDGTHVLIYELAGQGYRECAASPALPRITASLLAASLEISKTRGQSEAVRMFREGLRSMK